MARAVGCCRVGWPRLGALFDRKAVFFTVLRDASLVRFSDGYDGESVGRMHGIVAMVVRERNRQSGRLTPIGGDELPKGVSIEDEATSAPMLVLEKADPTDKDVYRGYGQQRAAATDLARHLIAFWKNAGRSARVAEGAHVALKCSNALNHLGDPYTGKTVANAALEICLGALGPDHPDTLRFRLNFCMTILRTGRIEEGVSGLLAALESSNSLDPTNETRRAIEKLTSALLGSRVEPGDGPTEGGIVRRG
jgi:hypothetical protein